MTIYVDIDGTICDTPPGGKYEEAVPRKEMIDKVNRLKNMGNRIVYYTARGATTGIDWFMFTYNQLAEWGCEFDGLMLGKPYFDFIVDDRAIHPDEIDLLISMSQKEILKTLVSDDNRKNS